MEERVEQLESESRHFTTCISELQKVTSGISEMQDSISQMQKMIETLMSSRTEGESGGTSGGAARIETADTGVGDTAASAGAAGRRRAGRTSAPQPEADTTPASGGTGARGVRTAQNRSEQPHAASTALRLILYDCLVGHSHHIFHQVTESAC